MEDNNKTIPVRVAVRVRPLVPREIKEGCQECLDISSDSPQVVVRGTEKAFTFDYAFSSDKSQQCIYDSSVSNVIQQLFKGYNVTILAYGQTGSGKTYSMGTSHTNIGESEADVGIIPRAITDIFSQVSASSHQEISVKVSFIELYKEVLYDLLNQGRRENTILDIREDPKGGIKFAGLTEIPVASLDETMKCLEYGALNRATGATAMNSRSSRSHAIFSLHLEIKNKEDTDNLTSAKFHLVDLAGSERAKKTCATGERFKEGVNINKGLLALGNVISSLCGEGSRGGHIPYRDSKLTRLLQDSLGGNSHTIMIACVSPADSNLEETLSTLRYADRARKIKNKPIVNRDPQTAELTRLRNEVQQLHLQLLASNAGPGSSVVASSNDISDLLAQNYHLKEENDKLTQALQTALEENTNMAEKALMAELGRDRMKTKLEELRAQTGNTVDVLNKTLDITINPQFEEQITLVKDLQTKIIDLQTEQQKSEKTIVDHELSRLREENTQVQNGSLEEDKNSEMASPVKGEFGAAYTLRQAKLNEELQGLNRALAMKEELMNKMSVNDDQFVAMRRRYEESLKGLEDQINSLLKEKEELSQHLRTAGSKPSNSNKISEQRRKRLQELEGRMFDLKKKVTEQNRLLKIKEQSELKVTKLNSEILNIKSARVKLIRQIKDDGEKFRKWKAQKDREVAKLKESDRQKQFQIVKMERLHSKQQNVLKRKMEEATAINKRLKDAMAVQKMCQERRAAARDLGSVNNKMKAWLEGELEVITVKKEAKHSLQTLIEDRKRISSELEKIKEGIEEESVTADLRKRFVERKKTMENELRIRNAQISDIQAKIVDEDSDAMSKKRFDSLQSMVEAKCALFCLFEMASQHQTALAGQKSELADVNCQYEDVCQNLEELENELKNLKASQQAEFNKLSREHEEKILFLLRQMPSTQDNCDVSESSQTDEALLQRLKFQEEELARLSDLHELLQQKTEECDAIKRFHERAKPKFTEISTPAKVEIKEKVFKKPKTVAELEILGDDDSDDGEADGSDPSDDDAKTSDPDWKKTPLFRRIREITSRSRLTKKLCKSDFNQESTTTTSPDDDMSGGGTKRTSAGEIKCGCSKDCATKLCKCRKNKNSCGITCKCSSMICVNRNTPNSTAVSDNSGDYNETLLNSTFNLAAKTRPLAEVPQTKRIRVSERPPGEGRASDDENFDPFSSGVLAAVSSKEYVSSMSSALL